MKTLFRSYFHYVFVLFSCTSSLAQPKNLIPNPGFELNTGCPGASVYLRNTNNWHKIKNHKGTPDYYYGNCDYHGIINPMAPGNLPYEGQGYVGQFVYYSHLNQCEYIVVKLNEKMVKDSSYYLEYYVLPSTLYPHRIDSYGTHFSTTEPKGQNDQEFKVVPLQEHIGNPKGSFITDTINWTKISGTYVAQGGEQYATFGNFRKFEERKTILEDGNIAQPLAAYMFIDGIGLKLSSDTAQFDFDPLVQPDIAILAQQQFKDSIEVHEDATDSIVTHEYDFREIIVKDTFYVKQNPVKIRLWDHLKYDHDTVTVLLDDHVLLKKIPIKKRKKSFKIAIPPGAHILKIVAVNLGEIPPNTVSVRLKDGKHERTYVLNSDLGVTEALNLKVE